MKELRAMTDLLLESMEEHQLVDSVAQNSHYSGEEKLLRQLLAADESVDEPPKHVKSRLKSTLCSLLVVQQPDEGISEIARVRARSRRDIIVCQMFASRGRLATVQNLLVETYKRVHRFELHLLSIECLTLLRGMHVNESDQRMYKKYEEEFQHALYCFQVESDLSSMLQSILIKQRKAAIPKAELATELTTYVKKGKRLVRAAKTANSMWTLYRLERSLAQVQDDPTSNIRISKRILKTLQQFDIPISKAKTAEVQWAIAMGYYSLGKFKECVVACEKAKQLYATGGANWHNVCIHETATYLNLGDYESACANMRTAFAPQHLRNISEALKERWNILESYTRIIGRVSNESLPESESSYIQFNETLCLSLLERMLEDIEGGRNLVLVLELFIKFRDGQLDRVQDDWENALRHRVKRIDDRHFRLKEFYSLIGAFTKCSFRVATCRDLSQEFTEKLAAAPPSVSNHLEIIPFPVIADLMVEMLEQQSR